MNASRVLMLAALCFTPAVLVLAAPPMLPGGQPDPAVTPGALNPDVIQETIYTTICSPGWTKTIRPPSSYTSRLKRRQLRENGNGDQRMADYEEDHLIPLELGGAPTDPKNLWPQPRRSPDGWTAERKDELENVLHDLVCFRQITLATAQHRIATNWAQAYVDLVDPSTHGLHMRGLND